VAVVVVEQVLLVQTQLQMVALAVMAVPVVQELPQVFQVHLLPTQVEVVVVLSQAQMALAVLAVVVLELVLVLQIMALQIVAVAVAVKAMLLLEAVVLAVQV
jgi:hypothetical protein